MTRREEIAEVLREALDERTYEQLTKCPNDCGCRKQTDDPDAHDCGCDGPCCMDPEWWDGRSVGEFLTDALLPLVDRLCAEAAADELRQAAEWSLVAVNWPHGGDAANELDRRAAELTETKETSR